jgi:hypothetical protein
MVARGGRREEQYRDRVLALNLAGLLKMWAAIKRGTPLPGWPRGKALEYLILRAFQLEGVEVTWPYRVYRQQQPQQQVEEIDGTAHFDGLTCLVECKDRARPTDITPIVKLKAQIMRRTRQTMGAVFSVNRFAPGALSLVEMLPPADVVLWQGPEIERALSKRWLCEGTRRKLRYAAKEGLVGVNLIETGDLK